MKDYKVILLEILDAIGYSDDKEAFITEFIKNIQLLSIQYLIKAMPSQSQKEINGKLFVAGNDYEKISVILQSFFSPEQIHDSIKNTAKDCVMEFISAVHDSLTDAQRNKLITVLEKAGTSQAFSLDRK